MDIIALNLLELLCLGWGSYTFVFSFKHSTFLKRLGSLMLGALLMISAFYVPSLAFSGCDRTTCPGYYATK